LIEGLLIPYEWIRLKDCDSSKNVKMVFSMAASYVIILYHKLSRQKTGTINI